MNEPGNIGPNEYSNYAWFHASLVEIFHQLEADYGQGYGPRVLNQIRACIKGRDYLTDKEMVGIFSNVAGDDLSQWFISNWGIGRKSQGPPAKSAPVSQTGDQFKVRWGPLLTPFEQDTPT